MLIGRHEHAGAEKVTIDEYQADGAILTSLVHEGTLSLAPPGIEFGVAEIFAAL